MRCFVFVDVFIDIFVDIFVDAFVDVFVDRQKTPARCLFDDRFSDNLLILPTGD